MSEPSANPTIETIIVPRTRDIGSFDVRRVLPSAQRQMVGPFIFFDQMGPATLAPDVGMDVRPHPHIGLATVTYLYDGTIIHRDSLGYEQPIEPGDVNWMTAGRGIVHSERSDAEIRKGVEHVSGLQLWVALPREREEIDPDFTHYPLASLPTIEAEGKHVRVVAGSAFGRASPVRTLSPLFYADVALDPGAALPLDSDHIDRAAYIVDGSIEIAGEAFDAGRMLVFRPGDDVTIRSASGAKFVVLGGEPLEGPRHIWWNFVSSSRDRIEQAKADWKSNRFDPVAGDGEFIPLPDK